MIARQIMLSGAVVFGAVLASPPAGACCPAPPSGKPVVNADQTVALVWDAATKTEHFIRRASFKSDADDFGFLVPTPSKPELDESGDGAFPFLQKVTEPDIVTQARPSAGCSGCIGVKRAAVEAPPPQVAVLAEKTVAGFHAVVLETTSSSALVSWLKEHGYAFSPEIEAWAKPYVEAGWKITALRVAKDEGARTGNSVAAASLRLSFHTDRPLFPYREPDTATSARALGATDRLLRIYLLSDGRYDGSLTEESPWTGSVAWAGKLTRAQSDTAFSALRLPAGDKEWWLTEFEDHWPYKLAPADLYFSRSTKQNTVRRPPIVHYASLPLGDPTFALGTVVALPLLFRSIRRRRRS